MLTLIELLERTSAVLQPFTREIQAGALVYDGTRYAPTSAQQSPDPFALAWWSQFQNTIALLRDVPSLSSQQRDYLRRSLCGGMGSFNDFALSTDRWGQAAIDANRQLDALRSHMCVALQEGADNVA